MDSTTEEDGPKYVDQLQDDHVVGEEVGVACGHTRTPVLETEVEDKDAEREEEEDNGDSDDGEAGHTDR